MEPCLQVVPETTVIAIVEDDAITREGLATLLSQQPQFRVACSVPDLNSPALREAGAHVILVNVRLTVGRSGQVPAELAELARRANIVATHLPDGCRHLPDLVRAGVVAFVLKDASLTGLVSTIRDAAAGARVMPPCLLEMLVSNLSRERESIFDAMTAQEQRIVRLIAIGKTNKEIAGERSISPHTVKCHVRHIMEKLSVHTRLQIAVQVNRERRWMGGGLAFEDGFGTPAAMDVQSAAGMQA